jgi:hypothetical protein
MNRLHVWRFASASAVTVALLSIACALVVSVAPGGTVALFNTWFHGLDLNLLVPPGGKPVTLGQVAVGALTAAVAGFVVGATLAACYNAFGAVTDPQGRRNGIGH